MSQRALCHQVSTEHRKSHLFPAARALKDFCGSLQHVLCGSWPQRSFDKGQEVWIAIVEFLTWYSKQLFCITLCVQSFWMMFSSPKEHLPFLWKEKKENSSYTVVALAHKAHNLNYTLFFSGNLVQVNKILARKKEQEGVLLFCNSRYNNGLTISV